MNQTIPTYSLTSPDWHNANQKPIPLATSASAGYNEYIFGRTTPDNKFIVATGLVPGPYGLEMVGGSKAKKMKKPVDKFKPDILKLKKILLDKLQKILKSKDAKEKTKAKPKAKATKPTAKPKAKTIKPTKPKAKTTKPKAKTIKKKVIKKKPIAKTTKPKAKPKAKKSTKTKK